MLDAVTPAEIRNVSAGLVNAAGDLEQIISTLPTTTTPETMTALNDLAQHLLDLAQLLTPNTPVQ